MAAKDTDLAKNDDQSDGNGLDISQAAIKKMIIVSIIWTGIRIVRA